ncbi:MAG: alpha/beta hydrolase [Acidobacteria bacterium]|nr:alpha/beta hydrolase [Acidobacteriota bacterium]
MPDLTVKRVPDAGHWIVHEKADLVNATIRDFIQGK